MSTNITFETIYWNKSLMRFFFRQQSQDTLEELMERAKGEGYDKLSTISEWAEGYDDIDEVEEMFYDYTVEELAEEIGLELEEDDEDEDEDEEEETEEDSREEESEERPWNY